MYVTSIKYCFCKVLLGPTVPTPPAYIIGYKFGEKNNAGIMACLQA